MNSPWVAPGVYTVRLTVNGKSQTQPITIKMDPRVKITPEVQQIFTITTRMENNARNAAKAYAEARALAAKANDALGKQLEEIAPAESAREGGRGGRGGGAGAAPESAAKPNLSTIGPQMIAAVMSMQASEMPPTAEQIEMCAQQEAHYTALMSKWTALKAQINGPAPAAKKAGARQ
jgi:hypothetical protein